LEPLHHAPDGFQAEGAASGKDDAVHGPSQVTRMEELEPVDTGRPAADLDAPHRGMVGQHHGDAGEPGAIGGVADAHSSNHVRVGARLTSASLTRPSATSPPISSPRMASALTNGICRAARLRSASAASAPPASRAAP